MINSIQEQTLFATIRIESTDNAGNIVSIGTGFLLKSTIKQGKYKVYLVSNKHVLNAGSGFILNFISKENDTPNFKKLTRIDYSDISKNVCGHVDQNVDIAAIDLTGILCRYSSKLYFKLVDMDMLATFNEPELNLTENVSFVGFPDGRYDKENNLPLIRTGIISSHPQFDYNGLPQFVIDAQVFPGSSGSPVFIDLTYENFRNGHIKLGGTRNYKLLGIISQTMVRNNRLQAIPTGTAFTTQEVLGLGIVFKSTEIRKLIESMYIEENLLKEEGD